MISQVFPNYQIIEKLGEGAGGEVYLAEDTRLGEAYKQTGMYDEAIREIQEAARLSGHSSRTVARLGHAYAIAGKKEEALAVLHKLNGISERQYVSPYEVAIIYAGLEEKELVFTWLERAYEDRSSWLTFLKVEPSFASIQSDARFIDLVKRVGLPAVV